MEAERIGGGLAVGRLEEQQIVKEQKRRFFRRCALQTVMFLWFRILSDTNCGDKLNDLEKSLK